jgi:hypothetical protein
MIFHTVKMDRKGSPKELLDLLRDRIKEYFALDPKGTENIPADERSETVYPLRKSQH